MVIYVYETGVHEESGKVFRDRYLFESDIDTLLMIDDFISSCRNDAEGYSHLGYQITTTFKEEFYENPWEA